MTQPTDTTRPAPADSTAPAHEDKHTVPLTEGDAHMGAVEGDRPDEPQQGNPHGDGLDDQGLPNDDVAICEDVLGANSDGTPG